MPASTRERPIRIGVVGGHPVIRGVVRLACESVQDSDVVAEGASVADAMELLAGPQLDVLVLDLDLPDGDGLAVLAGLTPDPSEPRTGPRVLVLSDRTDGPTVIEALRLGATGFLMKSDGLRGLAHAVREVAAGRGVIPPTIEATAIAEIGRFARTASARARLEAALTQREREVLSQLADGRTIRQVARRLSISPRTVETHVSKIYEKLGARSRVQAVSRAATLGLIEL